MEIDSANLELFCGRAFVVKVHGARTCALNSGDEFSPKYGGGRYRFDRITGNPECKFRARVGITNLETGESKSVDPRQIYMTISEYVNGTHNSDKPRGGDAIRLTKSWHGVEAGKIGVLNGYTTEDSDGGSVIFKPSTHRCRKTGHVSVSGGPGSIHTEASELRQTDDVVTLSVWDWGLNMPGADMGVYYFVLVRVWDWFPPS